MTARPLPRSIKFAIVAGVCALLHNLIVITSDGLGIHYVLSNVVSYAACVSLGYGLHASWTYSQPASLSAFGRYAVPMLANYPASVALLFLLCDLARLPMIIAAPLATVTMFVWNFVMTRWALIGSQTANTSTP